MLKNTILVALGAFVMLVSLTALGSESMSPSGGREQSATSELTLEQCMEGGVPAHEYRRISDVWLEADGPYGGGAFKLVVSRTCWPDCVQRVRLPPDSRVEIGFEDERPVSQRPKTYDEGRRDESLSEEPG